MKVLAAKIPTAEQMKVVQDSKPGVSLIRGAAGTGKTTTALLRLKFLCRHWLNRRARLGLETPVRVLVLTYNRTLRGYVAELASQQATGEPGLELEVRTFGKWAKERRPDFVLLPDGKAARRIKELGAALPLDPGFLYDEVDYAISRFLPDDLEQYLACKREGRGASPRMERPLRRRLLDEVIAPYVAWKRERHEGDWNDLALALATCDSVPILDVVVVDEAQDFSANQIRAIQNHLAPDHSVSFVLDAVQSIYPRTLRWKEVGIDIQQSWRLAQNHRNTVEIAAFARPLVDGLAFDDDGTLPDFSSCTRKGPLPVVLRGKFSGQVDYLLGKFADGIDLKRESVAVLLAKGGNWFDYLRGRLREAERPYAMIVRESEWPSGPENIVLSTIHSAKGLEFDHVFILGLNAEIAPAGSEEGDTSLENLRRLVAMGIGRAHKTATLGYKPEDPSPVLGLLDPATYEELSV